MERNDGTVGVRNVPLQTVTEGIVNLQLSSEHASLLLRLNRYGKDGLSESENRTAGQVMAGLIEQMREQTKEK